MKKTLKQETEKVFHKMKAIYPELEETSFNRGFIQGIAYMLEQDKEEE